MINVVRRKAQVDELKARYGAETHVVVFDGQNEAEAIAHVNAITKNKGVNIGNKRLYYIVLGKYTNV